MYKVIKIIIDMQTQIKYRLLDKIISENDITLKKVKLIDNNIATILEHKFCNYQCKDCNSCSKEEYAIEGSIKKEKVNNISNSNLSENLSIINKKIKTCINRKECKRLEKCKCEKYISENDWINILEDIKG